MVNNGAQWWFFFVRRGSIAGKEERLVCIGAQDDGFREGEWKGADCARGNSRSNINRVMEGN